MRQRVAGAHLRARRGYEMCARRMPSPADDAPSRPSGACLDDGGARLWPDDPSHAEKDAASTVDGAMFHAYPRLPAPQRCISALVAAFVAAKTPKSVEDDIVH